MTEQPIIEDAVSIVPIRDMRRTVEFYTGVLRFDERFVAEDGSFAIIGHGPAVIHFVSTDSEEALKATAGNIAIYLWVKHLDALYENLKNALETLPANRVRAPFTQEYGMKEFHVRDPDGCLLIFGEDVS